jgi:sigma-B regulation protein RsbU (phosphoserine phosphatase)
MPTFVEIAIYVKGVSANFGALRTYLIVSCSAAFALMGAVILIGIRFPHYMRGKKVDEELALARRVQHDLFPTQESLAVDLPFAAKCVPAWQVGGDLYDVFDTDDGEVALILGDVSGKGLPAALLMGVVQGAVRASSGTGASVNHEQAAERLNQLLCMKTARERFVSLFWCYFDRQASTLRYINAGHLPPLLIRNDGSSAQVVRLDEGGPVLGLLPGARYTQAQVEVRSGDLLVVYSDGILEAENARGDEFGEDGIIAAIAKHPNTAPDEICAAVLEEVRVFLGTGLPQDDQTLLIARLDRVTGSVTAEPLIHSRAV